MTDLPELLDLAVAAVRRASSLCLAVLAADDPDAMAKDGQEPVTIADYGSQAVILATIGAAHPDHRIISEEGSQHLREHAGESGSGRIVELVGRALEATPDLDQVCAWIDHAGGESSLTWAIDPIDGTKGFLRRDQFAVAVGLLFDGRPVAGVLGCPHFDDPVSGERGMIFWGGEGLGAGADLLGGGAERRVEVSDRTSPEGVRVLGSVESAHGDPALVGSVIERSGLGGGVVRLDSQVKYAAVAAGMAEVYLRPRSRPDYREKVWDHAAGTAVVEAAGGMVTDLDGALLDFGLGSTLEANRGVLATNGRVHGTILESIASA